MPIRLARALPSAVRALPVLTLLLALTPSPAPAPLAAVTGRVDVAVAASAGPGVPAAYAARSFRPAEAPPAEAAPAVVWLEAAAPRAATAGVAATPVLNQEGRRFIPRLLVVRRGQAVRVLNADPVYHNVFSLSPVKRFDVGRRRTGEAVTVRFGQAGVVDVFCDIHAHMRATILVLPETAAVVAHVTPGAPFHLTGLTPGTYRLGAFTPGAEPVLRTITVAAGRTLDVGTLALGGAS